MADWALSTNLFTWAQAGKGFFAWPAVGAEADDIRSMNPGDVIVPKYAQAAAYGDATTDQGQRAYCDSIEVDYDDALRTYEETIRAGAGAVPEVLRVTGAMEDDTRYEGQPWARVSVTREALAHPLSTKEFLRLRVIPPAVAQQFKAAVAQGRHLQKLEPGTANAVIAAARSADRADALRRYTLIRSGTPEKATQLLTEAGRTPVPGDRAFLATGAGLLGVYDATSAGTLRQVGAPIPRTPQELLDLFAEATRKATPSDYFTPKNAVDACNELQSFLDGSVEVLAVDDFGRWHDRYELLASKVTKADELARRAEPPASKEPAVQLDEDTGAEADEVAVLEGLTIEAVRAELPEGMSLPDDVLREVVTALRAGKHLLLGGPPGTGKSTLAEAVARAVMGTSYEVTTATADWTTFDTIGGYLPNTEGGVAFVPGVVLRALRAGRWLIIDEMNRADIDKAFGALFTLLNGANSQATRRATLPYQDSAGKPISITWAERRSGEDFTITDHWRLIGTLNIADKASLFQLSFAFLRRFAVIDVPLPTPTEYWLLLTRLFGDVAEPQREELARAGLKIAFGPRQIGPAILADVAQYVAKGISPVAGGDPLYAKPVDAFLVATKLLVVPQYEGAEPPEGIKLVASLTEVWPDLGVEAWDALRGALAAVALK